MNSLQWHWEFLIEDGYGRYRHIEIAESKAAALEQAIASCGSHAYIRLIRNWLG